MMHLSLCTISFRHHLVSLPELATFASQNDLDGLELWAAHVRNLYAQPHLDAAWLKAYGLDVSMLSDYLPTTGSLADGRQKMDELCNLARHWDTGKLRIFAGNKASAALSAAQRKELVVRLKDYCRQAADAGLQLLIETHPNTGADTTSATLNLLADVDHSALKINFDVLHIWEAGEEPIKAWQLLAPYVQHLHLKNISGRKYLNVFEPSNIYSAAGSREGIVPLFEGAYDFAQFLLALPQDRQHSASLEWFGGTASEVIAQDCQNVRQLLTETEAPFSRISNFT